VVARRGAEEFALLLPDAVKHEPAAPMECLQAELLGLAGELPKGVQRRCTVSPGA
jgi:hypothetical protein